MTSQLGDLLASKWARPVLFFLIFGFIVPMLVRHQWGALIVIAAIIGIIAVVPSIFASRVKRKAPSNFVVEGPHVTLGTTTGALAMGGHANGAAANVDIILGPREITQSMIFLGETGSSKTSAGINPVTIQLIQSGASFVYMDGKGDMARLIERIARQHGRDVLRIGVGGGRLNVLRGLSPQQIGKIIKDALRQSDMAGADSGFWTASATSIGENALTVLGDESKYYNLHALRRFVFNEAFYKERIAAAQDRLAELQARVDAGDPASDKARRALRMALEFFSDQYDATNERTRKDMQSTLATILQPFQNPALVDAFCADDDDVDLNDLDRGSIFILELPFSEYDLAAPLVMLFLKERVFRLIKTRALYVSSDARRKQLTGIIADEYQKLASPTDTDSLDVIRSLGGFVIAGTQSLNALIRALGSRENAYALLQNFVQKISFGTTDPETIEFFATVVGEVDIMRQSTSQNYGLDSSSSGRSWSEQRVRVITGQVFRALTQDDNSALAIALLKINGQAYDDVIRLPKIFVDRLVGDGAIA